MFRASDYQPPVLHETYSRKPIPTLQLHSKLSKFDSDSNPNSARHAAHAATTFDKVPEPVPVRYDTIFDPSNPKADWSGLVSVKDGERKHDRCHPSQKIQIMQSEHGIVNTTEDRTEIPRKRKDSSRVSPRDCKENLIGGISSEEEQWKTTYGSLTTHERTSVNQLTLMHRSKPRKPIDINEMRRELSANPQTSQRSDPPEFYRPAASSSNKSFISNIGASIVNDMRR